MSDVPRQHGFLPPIVDGWLGKYSPTSRSAYRQAVMHWCRWVGEAPKDLELGVALLALHSPTSGEGVKTVLRWYRTALANEDRPPAKIRQHLAALRSFRAYCQDGDHRMDADAETRARAWLAAGKWKRIIAYTSTEQPAILPEGTVSQMLARTTDARDQAILALLVYHRLTPAAIAALDYDETPERIKLSDEWADSEDSSSPPPWQRNVERQLEKPFGKLDWEWRPGRPVIDRFPLRRAVLVPLKAWLEERGRMPGALFTNRDRAGKGARLTTRSINRIVHDAGARIGRGDLTPRHLRRAGQPGGRRTAAWVRAIEIDRRRKLERSLDDFDPNVRWDWGILGEGTSRQARRNEWAIRVSGEEKPRWLDRPPWAWRDPALRRSFAWEVRDAASWQVERGYRSTDSWRELMALLAKNVAGFKVPVVVPTAPPAKPAPQRRRRALYAR